MFKPVSTKVDFPTLETEILRWWEETRAFEKLVAKNAKGPQWRFIDGPITANNPMGVHHAWGRTYKDLWHRYKAMQGFQTRYQNGFDGQGLWVEVEVEKELGFRSKREIEAFGVDRFVERCKARVRRFAAIQTEQSKRLGQWMDWATSYQTMSDENNYGVWGFLKRCYENGWIYRGTDVMPWCPRCGTGLSQQEIVTEGYVEVTHPAVTVRFPLRGRPGEALLVWTTTPWTLSSNVAAAVGPDLVYARVKQGDAIYYLSKDVLGRVLTGAYETLGEIPGREMEGWTYDSPFDDLPAAQAAGAHHAHRVILWGEVGAEEGTGIVHIAPGCGAEDFALGKEHGLPVVAPLDESGVYTDGFGGLSGRSVEDVAEEIFAELRRKGLLYRVEPYEHRYPHCWRCQTELVFRLVDEWYIRMEPLRQPMMEVVRQIRWIPSFGLERELDWLRNMRDWMISKKRYWGLALPIWQCGSCNGFEVIGSKEELRERASEAAGGSGWEAFEGHSPHRPWIDAVKIRCRKCGGEASRIPDVGNPWLDAGIVPFSTLRYREDRAYWEEWFPADFITESFPGQFRNWFYSLLAMSTALENRPPFKTVLGFATVLGEDGREMHKSWGNAIEFNEAADRAGADTMRWTYLAHRPESNLLFGFHALNDTRRRFVLTLWNVYAFFVNYARIDGWTPERRLQAPSSKLQVRDDGSPLGNELPPSPTWSMELGAWSRERSDLMPLDRWVLARLQQVTAEVTAGLDEYDAYRGALALERFVEDLSNWYVRRSRRRFWRSESDTEKEAAYATLYQVLSTLVRLVAPFMPFLAEAIYQNLVRSVDERAPESVHHTRWPEVDARWQDEALIQQMALAMRVAGLGRAARNSARIKLRQPLAKAIVAVREHESIAPLREIVADELNVKDLEFVAEESALVEHTLLPNSQVLGPRLGPLFPKLRSRLQSEDTAAVVRAVQAGQPWRMTIEGREIELMPGDLLIQSSPRPGLAVAGEGGVTVAVDTRLTPELTQEGLAREAVRRVQELRKNAGLEMDDRIDLYYTATPGLASAMERHAAYLRDETLAVEVTAGPAPVDAATATDTFEGETLQVAVVRRPA
jgi:isoleucyl-tRNA synthetase